MADGTERPSKWIPITDLVDLAHLGKLGEEAGELIAILSRCIIQGMDECDPETGKNNTERLAEELADVIAMSELAMERFNISSKDIELRINRKKAMKRHWHSMLTSPP